MDEKIIASSEIKDFVNSDDFEPIVQNNYEDYKCEWLLWTKKQEKISLTRKLSWNWWAFAFSGMWLLYRKMYRIFFIFLGVNSIPLLAFTLWRAIDTQAFLRAQSTDSLFWEFAVWLVTGVTGLVLVFMGAYGHNLYLQHCFSIVEEANAQFSDPAEGLDDAEKINRNEFLDKVGGVSLFPPFLFFIILVFFFSVLGETFMHPWLL